MAFSTPSETVVGSSGLTSTLTLSGNQNAGDALIAIVSVRVESTVPTLTVPTGFVEAARYENTYVTHAVFYKESDGTETSLAFTNDDATNDIRVAVSVYPSAGGLSFITASSHQDGVNNADLVLGPVTAEAGDLLVAMRQMRSTNPPSSWNNGFTENVDINNFNPRLKGAYKLSAGGSESVTHTSDGSYANNAGTILVFREVSSGPDYTQRKGSTWDVSHGLGTITSATLGGNAITINSTGSGTVNLTDTSGITTSGEYDLVLDDGTNTVTYTVQLNVIGLPAYTLNKDGAALGNLTGVKCVVTATGELDGTELYSANNLTATAGVMDSAIFLDTGDVDDVVTVSILTGANDGVTVETTVELL